MNKQCQIPDKTHYNILPCNQFTGNFLTIPRTEKHQRCSRKNVRQGSDEQILGKWDCRTVNWKKINTELLKTQNYNLSNNIQHWPVYSWNQMIFQTKLASFSSEIFKKVRILLSSVNFKRCLSKKSSYCMQKLQLVAY